MDVDDDERKPAATNNQMAAATTAVESGTTTAVKPVLIKTQGGGRAGGKNSNKATPSTKKQSKHLKWDEQVIEEHDLLRGTRMKIDEPNTPYTYYSDSGAESDDSKRQHCKSPANQKNTISWDSLQNRLDSVANVQQHYQDQQQQQQHDVDGGDNGATAGTAFSEDGSESLHVDEHKKEMRKLEFQDHRKRHYNEFQMIQRFRREHPDDGDDDADGEGGGAVDDDDGDDADAED